MTDSLRPKSLVPPYPPYKVGALLEEYVYDTLKDQDFGDFQYIDAFWTNLYSNRSFAGVQFNVQAEIDALNESGKYFTVCQNDDGVLENLPRNTIKFCAGGNRSDENTIPIPLVVDGFPAISEEELNKERTILASFVGSNTHPIRVDMHKALKGFRDVKMTMKGWDINVNGDQFNNFLSDSLSSYFVLAPRGYGKTSVSGTDEALVIPLDRSIIPRMTTPELEILFGKCLYLFINVVKIIKVKWYQRGAFKVLLTVAAIVIAVVSVGAGAPISAYLLAAAYAVAVGVRLS